ncbi:hypothetical protein BJK06_09835 [Curtobacterium sp. BH-2-1-1]|nr:hypothetical protein BJK06_09835 [Curtobacterium sp. BH-2-1-1]
MTTAYRFLTPDGWYRYRTADAGPSMAQRFVERHIPMLAKRSDLPERDRVVARQRAERDIERALSGLRDIGTADVFFFDGQFGGYRANMMITVTAAYLGPKVAELRSDDLAAGLGGDLIELPAGPAVRTRDSISSTLAGASGDTTTPDGLLAYTSALRGDEDAAGTLDQTRVEYLIRVPDESGTFVVVSFRGVGTDFVDQRVAHFDILMSGFAWTTA